MRPHKVISGGQTGADQGGLAAAKTLDIPTGGFAPTAFITENGKAPWLSSTYGLEEISGTYSMRTLKNISVADATVIFSRDKSSPGTKLTVRLCKEMGKPYLLNPNDGNEVLLFCITNKVKILNVAGNRESKSPGTYQRAFDVIKEAFSE